MNMSIIEDAVKAGLLPSNVIDRLKSRKCPICGKQINTSEFRDALSLKEFTISGMCQADQDAFFIFDVEEEQE